MSLPPFGRRSDPATRRLGGSFAMRFAAATKRLGAVRALFENYVGRMKVIGEAGPQSATGAEEKRGV
jgi:hypothetical protein